MKLYLQCMVNYNSHTCMVNYNSKPLVQLAQEYYLLNISEPDHGSMQLHAASVWNGCINQIVFAAHSEL
ncbi:hypothetical protein XENTR_v10020963 [Xenopus tropicalis]|nr:hypothetical protein XENTR_v10020963 [Xenopus tropicalis]